MTSLLTTHLAELAEALHDLRQRLRQAARVEVARTIGETLRELTLTAICGSSRYPTKARSPYSTWDDPWQEPTDDRWPAHNTYAEEIEEADADGNTLPVLPPALVAAVGAARWVFARTRQLGPALLVGLLVAVAASVGGPAMHALVKAAAIVNDLLIGSSLDQRP